MCPLNHRIAPGVAQACSRLIGLQASYWAPETRGNEIPSWASDHWTSPEQSKELGPASPQM